MYLHTGKFITDQYIPEASHSEVWHPSDYTDVCKSMTPTASARATMTITNRCGSRSESPTSILRYSMSESHAYTKISCASK